jgi:hypothetical protein
MNTTRDYCRRRASTAVTLHCWFIRIKTIKQKSATDDRRTWAGYALRTIEGMPLMPWFCFPDGAMVVTIDNYASMRCTLPIRSRSPHHYLTTFHPPSCSFRSLFLDSAATTNFPTGVRRQWRIMTGALARSPVDSASSTSKPPPPPPTSPPLDVFRRCGRVY